MLSSIHPWVALSRVDEGPHLAATQAAFPGGQRMEFAVLGRLKRSRAEKTQAIAKIVRIQGFTEACQSL
jgi:hypothetical protein